MNSEAIDQIATALAAAQTEIEDPHKNKTGKIKGTSRSGSSYEYEYKYADIADVLKSVRTALSKNGIAVSQPTIIDGGDLIVRTRLLHSSGQWLESDYPVCSLQGDHQKMGAAMTYARRYALTSLVGVAADEDTDGQGAETVTPKSNGWRKDRVDLGMDIHDGGAPRETRRQRGERPETTARHAPHKEFEAELAEVDTLIKLKRFEDAWSEKLKGEGGNVWTMQEKLERKREELHAPAEDEDERIMEHAEDAAMASKHGYPEPTMAQPDPNVLTAGKLKSALSAAQDEADLDRIKRLPLFTEQFKKLPTPMQAQVLAHGATIRARFNPSKRRSAPANGNEQHITDMG